MRFPEEVREWRIHGLLYVDDLNLCRKLGKKDLKGMVECFIDICRRRGPKVNADNNRVIVLGKIEGLECGVRVDGTRLEQMSEL